jgi:flagellar biosynthetic protein FliR
MTGLLDQLTGMAQVSEAWLWAFFLVFLRVGAMMALMPAFGEQSVPMRVRLVLTLAFTAVVAPAVVGRIGPGAPALALAGEVMAGLAMGIGMRMFIFALQMAGAIIAQGTSLSQAFGGAAPEPLPAIGNLLTMAGLAIAVLAGLHVKAAALMILSYDILPPGRLPGAADLAQWGLAQVIRAFSLAFSLAAPFTLAALVYNVALGVINRAMPQLMVSFVGAPALTAGAMALMVLVIPLALLVWRDAFDLFLAAPFRIAP